MTIVNTSKSIFQKLTGHAPEAQKVMPVDPPTQDPAPDAVEEDEDDRVGNTDPQTNAPPEEDPLLDFDPAQIRQHALLAAAAKSNAAALNAAGEALNVPQAPAPSVVLTTFKYLSVGDSKGIIQAIGVASNGAPFSVQKDVTPNMTVAAVAAELETLWLKFL